RSARSLQRWLYHTHPHIFPANDMQSSTRLDHPRQSQSASSSCSCFCCGVIVGPSSGHGHSILPAVFRDTSSIVSFIGGDGNRDKKHGGKARQAAHHTA